MLDIYQELVNITLKGELAVMATVVSSQGSAPRKAGAKMLIKKDGTLIGTVGGGAVERRVQEKAIELMNSGEPQILNFDLSGTKKEEPMICGGQMTVFMEPVLPLETLYLFGAGHISRSTAPVAKMLGFHIVVIDPRPEHNNSNRFPDADSLVVEDYASAFSKLNINVDSYIVILTPGHVSDEQCLEFAVGTGAKYVGMIGSKKKVREIKEHLSLKGVSQQRLDGIYSPIGLDVNAESPEEIAVSILAEIIKVRRSLQVTN